MDNNITNSNENKSLESMNNNELLDILWKALNKANGSGVFNIDEAFTLKVIYEKLKKNIE
tara:strand:+ start:505 stop:684 length:180 start_codon:yes stop_codon:yes gene_type:complete